MVLVHGSSGIGINIDHWARELNKIGVASFLLDCFTACGNQFMDCSQLPCLIVAMFTTMFAISLFNPVAAPS
jgi:hypothetical protein